MPLKPFANLEIRYFCARHERTSTFDLVEILQELAKLIIRPKLFRATARFLGTEMHVGEIRHQLAPVKWIAGIETEASNAPFQKGDRDRRD